MDSAGLARFELFAAALGRAVDAKGAYEPSHSDAVASLCGEIALVLGLEHEHRTRVRLAGLLHDVGKIGIPDAIVHKPDRLTAREFEAVKVHAELGAEIVAAADLADEAGWVRHHHERFDGGGYPDGLAGAEIPLESRIIFAADAFAVMTAERHYREPVPVRAALEELEANAGSQFDPVCVAAVVHCRGIEHPSTHALTA